MEVQRVNLWDLRVLANTVKLADILMSRTLIFSLACAAAFSGSAADHVFIKDVPDYPWHAGCFGSACGNLMGYWDRNGFPDFYTGPTGGGLAPLNSSGENVGIHSLWASQAGVDGRPLNKPGHIDDYWDYYEGAQVDPYVRAGRAEHEPDCVGDFMGASQNKWTDLGGGECNGNLDAFSFNFWDKSGARRVDFEPPVLNGTQARDLQSGFRKWAASRGYKAEVFSQMPNFSSEIPVGTGFTLEELKAELEAGYPVMLFLQLPGQFSRTVDGKARMNPLVHGMLTVGYYMGLDGSTYVQYRTSWGGDGVAQWKAEPFEVGMNLRGVIGFHPEPKIRDVAKTTEGFRIRWDGPSSTVVYDSTELPVHWYVVERADTVTGIYTAVSEASPNRETVVANCCDGNAFFRVKLLNRADVPQ